MSRERSTYIFDLDGTLASCDWRRFLVERPDPDWSSFFDRLGADAPVASVVAQARRRHARGHEVIVVSGRPHTYRYETEFWLGEHEIPYDLLLMRSPQDQRPDHDVKEAMLLSELPPVRRIAQVFDDSPRVIEMWRSHGLAVTPVQDPNLPPLLDRSASPSHLKQEDDQEPSP